MKTKQKITMLLSLILTILLISTGLSFAYFSANITGTETSTTIQASGGVMNIDYDGGENINTPNIFPSNEPFATKNFTLTGKSTTNDNMNYHIILVIEENTFTNNALQYKLISTNTDNNGAIAPSIVQSGIATGTQEIFLGDGTFESPVNNKLHSYNLKLYFPDTGKSQDEDQGKIFKAYIKVKEGEYDFPGYNEDKGVNHPVLFTGMTPIKWDENNKEINTTADDPDWYDYDEKRWANAKSADGSYWVWIPRYAYKITSGYHSSETGTIDVKFLKGSTNMTVGNTIIESAGYIPHEKDTSMHYFLHPAFQFVGEKTGFWMAKFEPTATEGLESGYTSGSCEPTDNVITKTVAIIPNSTSWRCINFSTAYKVSKKLSEKTEIYGWNKVEVDSHLINNIEWGVVAYLSKSQYGADGEVWNNAYKEFITGCSGPSVDSNRQSTCVEYNTPNGVKASTTYNIYGVYDMSSGSNEFVLGNINNFLGSSGFTIEQLSEISSVYINRYKVDAKYNYGDAIYETSSGSGVSSSWFADYSLFPSNSTSPFFRRGGNYTYKTIGGVFNYNATTGSADALNSFRPVLMPI
ncbi:MAG TPA: hypothetical protein GX713_01960 [Mollicutes bacterium]|nr:hypothetical protein [Mollicutes bacterium]